MSFGRMSVVGHHIAPLKVYRDAKKLPKNYADEMLFKTDNVCQKVDGKNKCYRVYQNAHGKNQKEMYGLSIK